MPRWMRALVLFLGMMAATGAAPVMARDESVKVATYNAFITSFFFDCFNPNFIDCAAQTAGRSKEWAKALADTLRSDPNRPDILVLNEVWDEDAKQVLVDELGGLYPTYVSDIDANLVQLRGPTLQDFFDDFDAALLELIYPGIPIEKINGEDSGLMLFAAENFSFVDLADSQYLWGNDIDEELEVSDSNAEVGFALFEDCSSDDCLAAKGAGLVRLQDHRSERIYDVVFTHMQADKPGDFHPTDRRRQLRDIRKLIEVSLGGEVPAEDRLLVMGDFNLAMPQDNPSEWNALFGPGGDVSGWPAYDAWATTNPLKDGGPNTKDEGHTNKTDHKRLDYIVAGPRPWVDDSGDPPPMCVQHVTIPERYRVLSSDHLMVLADTNLGAHFCSPNIAFPVKLEQTVATTGEPLQKAFLNTDTRINWPGAMQWFHVGGSKQDTPGTYTIGLSSQAVQLEIYRPEDMTNPISRYYKQGKIEVADGGEQRMFVNTYVLPAEFYIRVSAVDPDATLNYQLWIRRHTCASRETACLLQPGVPQGATLIKENNIPPSQQDQAWFAFDITGQSDSGANQVVTLFGQAPDDPNFKTSLVDFADAVEPTPGETTGGGRTTYSGAMSEGATGYIVVEQANRTASNIDVSAGFDTSLRGLTPLTVVCRDETNPEFGSDDIYVEMQLDGVGMRFPAGGEYEFDCDEPQHERSWSQFGPPVLRFTQSALVRPVEADVDPDDAAAFAAVPTLPPEAEGFDGTREPFIWKFEDGEYWMLYRLEKRLNEPVK